MPYIFNWDEGFFRMGAEATWHNLDFNSGDCGIGHPLVVFTGDAQDVLQVFCSDGTTSIHRNQIQITRN